MNVFTIQIKRTGCVLLLAMSVGVVGCSNLNNLVGIGNSTPTQSGTNIYNKDKTYIKLEEMRTKKGGTKVFFDHPKYLNGDDLTSVLSSLYFKEKSVKGWGKQKNIFQESELLTLVPHIVRAFSKTATGSFCLPFSLMIFMASEIGSYELDGMLIIVCFLL